MEIYDSENVHKKRWSCNIYLADTFFARFKGLMFKKEMAEDEGLLISSCNSIHTFCMHFSIDTVFLDGLSRVVYVLEGLKPYRLSPIIWESEYVLELNSKTVGSLGIFKGDFIKLTEFN